MDGFEMAELAVNVSMIALSLSGIAVAASLVAVMARRMPLYLFVIARRGHIRILEACAIAGGAANIDELHQQLKETIGTVPSAKSLGSLLEQLTRAKLVHAIGEGASARYLLTNLGRQRLEIARRG